MVSRPILSPKKGIYTSSGFSFNFTGMKSLPRPLLIAGLAIIILTTGSLLLIRSCIYGKGWGGAPSGMREQYAAAPALYLEKEGRAVVFTLVPHLKIHSYTRRGNSVQRSASTTYYLQTNDAVTAEKTGEQQLIDHSDLKSFPVEILGASASLAWLYAGELMAFDAFSLEKKADAALLEQKNSRLAGQLPAERRYYRFDKASGFIFITAKDGSKWKLDTRTLLAQPVM